METESKSLGMLAWKVFSLRHSPTINHWFLKTSHYFTRYCFTNLFFNKLLVKMMYVCKICTFSDLSIKLHLLLLWKKIEIEPWKTENGSTWSKNVHEKIIRMAIKRKKSPCNASQNICPYFPNQNICDHIRQK